MINPEELIAIETNLALGAKAKRISDFCQNIIDEISDPKTPWGNSIMEAEIIAQAKKSAAQNEVDEDELIAGWDVEFFVPHLLACVQRLGAYTIQIEQGVQEANLHFGSPNAKYDPRKRDPIFNPSLNETQQKAIKLEVKARMEGRREKISVIAAELVVGDTAVSNWRNDPIYRSELKRAITQALSDALIKRSNTRDNT
jgi:hypothetical protein